MFALFIPCHDIILLCVVFLLVVWNVCRLLNGSLQRCVRFDRRVSTDFDKQLTGEILIDSFFGRALWNERQMYFSTLSENYWRSMFWVRARTHFGLAAWKLFFSTELFIAFPHQPSALQNKTMTAKISAKKSERFLSGKAVEWIFWKQRKLKHEVSVVFLLSAKKYVVDVVYEQLLSFKNHGVLSYSFVFFLNWLYFLKSPRKKI